MLDRLPLLLYVSFCASYASASALAWARASLRRRREVRQSRELRALLKSGSREVRKAA